MPCPASAEYIYYKVYDMKYRRFTFNPIGVNTYVVWDEDTLDAAVIDAGMYTDGERRALAGFIADEGLRPVMSLQTHMHFDHIAGLPFIFGTYGSLRPLYHHGDERLYYSMPLMARYAGMNLAEPLPAAERFLADGEELHLAGVEIQVIHTPGHTPGGVCLYVPDEGILFSGDTLFRGSMGRTDLPGGDYRAEIESITERLFILPPDTLVLPGHGETTTIGEEMAGNPYLV